MKIPLWLTIVVSALFIAIMFAWKQIVIALVAAFGSWIGFAIGGVVIALAYLFERRKRPVIDR